MAVKKINNYYIADYESDLALITDARLGSKCHVIETATDYVCNSEGKWFDTIPDIKNNDNTTGGSNVDLTGYATEEFVKEEISKIEIPDIPKFTTPEELEAAIANLKEDAVFKIMGKDPNSFAVQVNAADNKTFIQALGEKGSGLYTCYIQKGVSDNPTGSASSCRGFACVNTWYNVKEFYAWILMFDSDGNAYTRYMSAGGASDWKKVINDLNDYALKSEIPEVEGVYAPLTNDVFKLFGEDPENMTNDKSIFGICVRAAEGKTLIERMIEKGRGLYNFYIEKGAPGLPDAVVEKNSSCRGLCCLDTYYADDHWYGWIEMFDQDGDMYVQYIRRGEPKGWKTVAFV